MTCRATLGKARMRYDLRRAPVSQDRARASNTQARVWPRPRSISDDGGKA